MEAHGLLIVKAFELFQVLSAWFAFLATFPSAAPGATDNPGVLLGVYSHTPGVLGHCLQMTLPDCR